MTTSQVTTHDGTGTSLEHHGRSRGRAREVGASCHTFGGGGHRRGVRGWDRCVRLALVSPYWALGGHGLVGTVGGFAEQAARRGGPAAMLLALAATAAKMIGGLLALALISAWGPGVPRAWPLIGSAAASVLPVGYGGLNVLAGALVLSGVVHPSGSVDGTALRWHVGLWDMWFLVWGSC